MTSTDGDKELIICKSDLNIIEGVFTLTQGYLLPVNLTEAIQRALDIIKDVRETNSKMLTTMEIDEDEAYQIMGAIKYANMEQGEPEEEDPIITRIRKEFPNIERSIKEHELRTQMWAVVAEQDKRVIAARKKIERTPLFLKFPDNDTNPKYTKAQDDFFKVKGIVYDELLKKAGLRKGDG